MSDIRQSWARFAAALGLILAAGIFLELRSGAENLPPREALAKLPLVLDGWMGRDRPIDPDELRVLGDGEFLLRDYVPVTQDTWMNLFIAYFATQRTGSTMHSPQNCLPGAGWAPIESGRITLQRESGESVSVNRYVIAKGLDRRLVLYWYQSHGRIVASEYSAKTYLVLDSMRLNRSDGALVRVTTPLTSPEDSAAAEQRAVKFAEMVLRRLGPFIPK